jgi:hypothetical protein
MGRGFGRDSQGSLSECLRAVESRDRLSIKRRVQTSLRSIASDEKKRPVGRFLNSSLAEVPAAVLATENCSWLADEAIANGVTVIVTAVVAVIVGI